MLRKECFALALCLMAGTGHPEEAAPRPWMGIQLSDASPPAVSAVIPGGPAEQAGLAEGDVILTCGGAPVSIAQDVIQAILRRSPGDRLELVIRREGRERKMEVVLGLHRSLAEEPDPPGPKGFDDVTERAGLSGLNALYRGSWGDVNEDSFPDLIVEHDLFLNRKDGTFEKVDLGKAGLAGNPGGAVTLADFDNDGHLDIYFMGGEADKGADKQHPYVPAGTGTGALYLGDGKGHFKPGEVAPNPSPFRAMGAAAADIDGDGWVDVYVANFEKWIPEKEDSTPTPDILLRNDRGALKLAWEAPKARTYPAYGVTACDFNEDGKVDLYVSNYRLCPNFLWVNTGDNTPFPFNEEGVQRGVAGDVKKDAQGQVLKVQDMNGLEYPACGHTIGSAWADFDNDGRFDLLVGNFSHPPAYQDRVKLLRNLGKEGGFSFEDKSAAARILWQESYATVAAADFDNDARVDFYLSTCYPNDVSRLFRNRGDWKFEDVTAAMGVRTRETFQAAWVDFDNDGRLDLLAGGRLFRNQTTGGNFLKVRLKGTHCNRSVLGAVAAVRAGGLIVTRQVEAGTGTGNQNDLVLHFGLGEAAGEVLLTVKWPCGRIRELKVQANTTVELTE